MTNSEKSESQELIELKERNKQYQNEIYELSTPIIPSIVPNTILVPLMGKLTSERLEHIQEKLVNNIHKQSADTVLIDFTGISSYGVEENMEYDFLMGQIHNLVDSLRLMGAETLFVGLSPKLVQKLVSSNVRGLTELNAHATFRTGLQYLLDKKGLEIREKTK
ncbi:STAS domain-containing protein [Evansella clarkii]|jgi:rsbT co-antagonist protein RsbR|uniref:STAS domain-containing protein n=1 Tax=Evansella clarkii TaxID=79879 RepID=UPI000998CE92|nr:STAS domain-containing protein [Evansella clarkii]